MPECCRKKQYSGIKKPRNKLFRGIGWGLWIRTLNDGARASQSFFKTAYLSRFSDFASLKSLSEFYFCLEQQIRMRNCAPSLRCRLKRKVYYFINLLYFITIKAIKHSSQAIRIAIFTIDKNPKGLISRTLLNT